MKIKRNQYLDKLISSRKNGLIKVITGIRRVGKTYLLFHLFYNYLLESGMKRENIIALELDRLENKQLRSAENLYSHILAKVKSNDEYIILIDEIQLVPDFVEILNSLLHLDNIDVYVTGSNSKFLSSDIVTEFRGRSKEIHILPLTYSEFISVYNGERRKALREYFTYGGLPIAVLTKEHKEKADYLKSLYRLVYIKDLVERKHIKNPDNLSEIISVLASQTGSLSNSTKIANTFLSEKRIKISLDTINNYIDDIIDAFLITPVNRFDIKGRKHIGALRKYYFEDIGLRNAMLDFNQIEFTHIMENAIFNELRSRSLEVNVGVVEFNYTNNYNARSKGQLEIDFLATDMDRKYYIQSAYSIEEKAKKEQEVRPFKYLKDSYKRILIVADDVIPHYDETGVFIINVEDFLLDKNSLNK